MRYFETRFLEEADGFISGLDPKTIKKIFYNIDLAEQTNDPKLLNPDYAIEITFSNLTFDSLSLITSFHFSPVEKKWGVNQMFRSYCGISDKETSE